MSPYHHVDQQKTRQERKHQMTSHFEFQLFHFRRLLLLLPLLLLLQNWRCWEMRVVTGRWETRREKLNRSRLNRPRLKRFRLNRFRRWRFRRWKRGRRRWSVWRRKWNRICRSDGISTPNRTAKREREEREMMKRKRANDVAKLSAAPNAQWG